MIKSATQKGVSKKLSQKNANDLKQIKSKLAEIQTPIEHQDTV
jgi:hypothetical protein